MWNTKGGWVTRVTGKRDAGESNIKIPKRVKSRNPETKWAVFMLIIFCGEVVGDSKAPFIVYAET